MRYVLLILLLAVPAFAKMDLVTVPSRDTVQITIYNSADLTLVRESRNLTLQEGRNRLQFSWANTLIDPTSLDMRALVNGDKIDVMDIVYPPRTQNLGMWTINSELAGKSPFEITYFTSGISWRAFYMGTLTADEKAMRLQGYVVVSNQSGEDYEDAQVRLIVGKVNILDQIAALAQRQYPYGQPIQQAVPRPSAAPAPMGSRRAEVSAAGGMVSKMRERQVVKEGLSEYFLYTIEGQDTIATGWSKRLPSFEVGEVPVVNLYKYDDGRYGTNVLRFLSFKNDEKHKLGETPIPGGLMRVYRNVDDEQHLSYAGQSEFQYIPVEEDVELSLGAVQDVIVEPTLMSTATTAIDFNAHRDIQGWDTVTEWKIEVKNTRDIPVQLEVTRHFSHQYWDLKKPADVPFEKIDLDTVRFTLTLPPRSSQSFNYTLTQHEGNNQNRN